MIPRRRNIVRKLSFSLVLLAGQWIIDDRRSDREIQISTQQVDAAERRENIRFIRDRSLSGTIARPFGGMDLRDQNFVGLQMSGADLRATDLTNAFLEEADLSGARFAEAKIYDTDFTGAKLTAADFPALNPKYPSACPALLPLGCSMNRT